MSALRVGVIGRTGEGGYGHQLDQAFTRDDRATIVAVSDIDETVATEKATELGAPKAYSDHREMLEREALDIVVVAPRHTATHLDLVTDALSHGCHVYCEKPLTQTLREADALVAMAEDRGLLLGQSLPFVHESRYQQVLDLIGSDDFGDLVQMRALCKWDHRGGGQDFLILGVHFADMMRRFAGNPRSCRASITTDGRPVRADDGVIGDEASGLIAGDRIHASYEFDGGVHGSIESWRAGIEDRGLQPYRLELKGTRGQIMIRAPYADHSLWVHPLPEHVPGVSQWQRVETEEIATYGDYHRRAASDFLDALEEGRPPACSGADGAAALEMIHAAYVAHLASATVPLPLEVRDHPLNVATMPGERA